MFPEGGQTRKHCFLATLPNALKVDKPCMLLKDGQTRKYCFLAMFTEGGQTRKYCFLATLPNALKVLTKQYITGHLVRR